MRELHGCEPTSRLPKTSPRTRLPVMNRALQVRPPSVRIAQSTHGCHIHPAAQRLRRNNIPVFVKGMLLFFCMCTHCITVNSNIYIQRFHLFCFFFVLVPGTCKSKYVKDFRYLCSLPQHRKFAIRQTCLPDLTADFGFKSNAIL